jgi:ATP-dependent 26S proteasome regulatory subunit
MPQENKLSEVCLDPNKPPEVRAKILLDVLHGSGEPAVQQAVLADVLRHGTANRPQAEAEQLKEAYEQALAELQQGPVRPATFIAPAEADLPGLTPRAHVVTPDGQERYPVLHPRVTLGELRTGMTVFLDPRGSVVLGSSPLLPRVGPEGTFLRRVEGTTLVETALQNERLMVYGAAPVLEAIASGRLRPGERVLVCPRRHVALAVVPPETDYRFRFLDRGRVPDVVAERDIGRPHWVLDLLVRRVRLMLFRPEVLRGFDQRPRVAVLLTGPSGCGKTLTIRAFLREFDRMLVERTGRNDLGSRVVRVKVSELLSEWLGRSDKNVEELFNDIQSVAQGEVETSAGERVLLPVVVVMEEVEGLARRRGEAGAAIYDRILATLLQRLDDPTDELGRLPLVLISTSNRPDLIDSAMGRRLGLQARFTRLDREGAAAVLDKKLKPHYPYGPGKAPEKARADLAAAVVKWLFGPGGEPHGMIEVALEDGKKLVKRRRDFLTGGLIDQAVASAIDRAMEAAEPALTAEAVIEALRQQTDSLADNLTADNALDYLDLPDNARVAVVRRLRGPDGGPLPSLHADLEN